VITRADIVERVREWQLTEEVVEKDYVLGWLLWGIGSDPILGDQWVFKGGTCLKAAPLAAHLGLAARNSGHRGRDIRPLRPTVIASGPAPL